MNLVEAEHLTFSYPGADLIQNLSFSVRPGLTLVRGGDGRGKTTLLRLMAAELEPGSGVVRHRALTRFHESAGDPAHDGVVARAWLRMLASRFALWDDAQEAQLVDDFDLSEHIDKPLYMLSTGSRRKVGLVAAAACQAELTLIDTPFAALDAASGRVLTRLLAQAAADGRRAWVLADYEVPAGVPAARLAGVIDLGD